MNYYSMTDIGKKRSNNEDSYFSKIKEINGLEVGLFVIADGMGGYEHGEYASQKTVEVIKDTMKKEFYKLGESEPSNDTIIGYIRNSVQAANKDVLEESMKRGLLMGSTVAIAVIFGNKLVVANVGDSRTYMLSDGNFVQISKDNSYVQELLESGAINSDEARTHSERNKITRAVGVEPEIQVDFYERELQKDDKLLICSDGLNSMLNDEEIKRILYKDETAKNIVEQLLDLVNEKGAYDNTTVTCVLI